MRYGDQGATHSSGEKGAMDSILEPSMTTVLAGSSFWPSKMRTFWIAVLSIFTLDGRVLVQMMLVFKEGITGIYTNTSLYALVWLGNNMPSLVAMVNVVRRVGQAMKLAARDLGPDWLPNPGDSSIPVSSISLPITLGQSWLQKQYYRRVVSTSRRLVSSWDYCRHPLGIP